MFADGGDKVVHWLLEVVVVVFVENNRLWVVQHGADFFNGIRDALRLLPQTITMNQNEAGVRDDIFLRQRPAITRAGEEMKTVSLGMADTRNEFMHA